LITVNFFLALHPREGLKWKARRTKVEFLRVMPATKEAEQNPTKTNLWTRTCNEKPDLCGHAKVIKKAPSFLEAKYV